MAKTTQQPGTKREVAGAFVAFEISRQLDASMDLRGCRGPLMKSMAEAHGMLRGHSRCSTVHGRDSHRSRVRPVGEPASAGTISGREGVTGKVIQTGQPAVVPRISEEPLFLDRTGARNRLSKKEYRSSASP